MNNEIFVLDRETKEVIKEKVYGKEAIEAAYGERRSFSKCLLPLIVSYAFASKFYGKLQSSSFSRKKVLPFIKKFDVDASDFLYPPEFFASFNDFFIRQLKKEARPLATGKDVAVMPADGRYLVFPDIAKADGFVVKGKKFSLEEFLGDKELSQKYEQGAMVIARLCPTDYHRYHFPFSCLPSKPKKIEGTLHSVNPLALRKKIEIFAENKREITTLQTSNFGQVLFVEVGATFVGAIHHTFSPEEPYAKGDEKGYFSFGGSSLVMLFEPGRIQFDQDLLEASESKLEVKGLMGQSLGRSLTP